MLLPSKEATLKAYDEIRFIQSCPFVSSGRSESATAPPDDCLSLLGPDTTDDDDVGHVLSNDQLNDGFMDRYWFVRIQMENC